MKTIFARAVLALSLLACAAASPALAANPGATAPTTITGPLTITPNACTIAQTVVSTSSTSGSGIAANANRKSLRFMVTGTANVTMVPGTGTAVVGAGMVYVAAPATNGQGGSDTFADPAVASNAFQVVSPAASSITFWECS